MLFKYIICFLIIPITFFAENIPLYWWRPTKGTNFGDELSHDIGSTYTVSRKQHSPKGESF